MTLLLPIDTWLITLVFTVAMAVTAEIGARLGRRMAPRFDEATRSQFAAVEAAVLALVGLFLAFTFSASADRFDMRRLLVVTEANAVGTAYLRTELLPEPARSQSQELMRRYVDLRLEFYEARTDIPRVRATIADAATVQRSLWTIAVEEARKDPRITMSLVLESLNAVIDISEERVIALESHVPEVIFILLMFVGCAGLGTVGFSFGLVGRRRTFSTLLLSVLVASIVYVIMDLDRPRQGLVLISQQAMRDLQQSMAR